MTGTAVCEDPPTTESDEVDDHLEDVVAGAGCTEIWEHLSERRAECADAD